jgi:hypothetical protein
MRCTRCLKETCSRTLLVKIRLPDVTHLLCPACYASLRAWEQALRKPRQPLIFQESTQERRRDDT